MTFKLQTWEAENFQGRSQFFYNPGGYQSPYKIRSYTWTPGTPGEMMEDRLRCSVKFCVNGEFFGWWGRSERTKKDIPWNATVTPPNVINIQCDKDFFEPPCPELSQQSTFVILPIMETARPSTDTTQGSATSTSAPLFTGTV
jgi:hypothetical protein